MVGKRIKNIAKFKADLESVVIRGDNSSGIQYVVEMDDSGDLYALYLVSRYGKRATALTARNIFMTRNEKVMALWSKYSDEGTTRIDASEHLIKYYEQL